MAQNTNLNIAPYFDDFDANKGFLKVLFKPGYPVQARELTTLQSLLQNQIDTFGQGVYKEGAMVIPGGTTLNKKVPCVIIQNTYLNLDVENYRTALDGQIIKGSTSGVRARILFSISATTSTRNNISFYINYIQKADDNITTTFTDGETFTCESDITYASTTITAGTPLAQLLNSNANAQGSTANVGAGVYYVRGYFANVAEQTIILDQYETNPSYKVGLKVEERIITADEDATLYDNAIGSTNFSAPGADRFKITLTLVKKLLTDPNSADFIELLRTNAGKLEKKVERSELGFINDILATRTKEESGDYYVKKFKLDVRENLDDGFNNGVYTATGTTSGGVSPSEANISVQLSSGQAYVQGYRTERLSTTYKDVEKPRTFETETNKSIASNFGNFVLMTNVHVVPTIYETVELRDVVTSTPGTPAGTVIGRTRVIDIDQNSGTPGFATTNTYKANVVDTDFYTQVVLGSGSGVSWTAERLVVGRTSGATAILVSGSSVTGYLTNITGEFAVGEKLDYDVAGTSGNGGLSGSRTISTITKFGMGDVKSYAFNSGAGTADAVLDVQVALPGSGTVLSSVVGTGVGSTATVTSTLSNYNSQMRVGDIVEFGNNGVAHRARVTLLSSAYAFNVSKINTGNMTNGGVNGAIVRTRAEIKEAQNKVLVSPLGYKAVKNTNNDNTQNPAGFFRKSVTAQSVSGGNVSIDAGAGLVWRDASDADDFRVIVTAGTGDGNVLTSGNGFTISGSSSNTQSVTLQGLSGVSSVNVIGTVYSSNRSAKAKTNEKMKVLKVDKTFGSAVNGLTQSTVGYGHRIGDTRISLGTGDVYKLKAVLESQDSNDPVIPNFTQTNLVGALAVDEVITGDSSGSRARVVATNGNIVYFLPVEGDVFSDNETITADGGATLKIAGSPTLGSKDITDSFTLDDGQRDQYYDYSSIVRKFGYAEPTNRIYIIFDRFLTTAGINPYTVDSYPTEDYKIIPEFGDNPLRNVIDFRPIVTEKLTNAGSITSPYVLSDTKYFDFANRAFTGNLTGIPGQGDTTLLSLQYYLGRVDKVFMSKNSVVQVVKGAPASDPVSPDDLDDAMLLGTLTYQPYVFNVEEDIEIKETNFKRYTFRDIQQLEDRIKTLEFYTQLSLLESETASMEIRDTSGLSRFKNGFMVDNFASLSSSDTLHPDYRVSLDFEEGQLRPTHYTTAVPITYSTSSQNVTTSSEDIVTLPYTDSVLIDQPYASGVENVNPFNVFTYMGDIQLYPESDNWVDTTSLSPIQGPVVEGNFLTTVRDYNADQNGFAPIQWNSWKTTWTGTDINKKTGKWRTDGGKGRRQQRRTITTTTTTTTKQTRTGIRYRVTPVIEQESLGNKVVSVEHIQFMRSRNIEFSCEKLKPRTKFYPFFDGIALPQKLITPKIMGVIKDTSTDPKTNNIPFQIGETVSVSATTAPAKPVIRFKGKVSAPNDGFQINPLDGTDISSTTDYTSNLAFINIDTRSLGDQAKGTYFGSPKINDYIIGETSGAIAKVSNKDLITDKKGKLKGSFFIDTPSKQGVQKFKTGTKLFRLSDSAGDSKVPGVSDSSGEVEFTSSGILQTTQETIISVRNAKVTSEQMKDARTLTSVSVDETEETRWVDPLAQTFLVDDSALDGGVFLTKLDLFFFTKDPEIPVAVDIRTVENGTPTQTVLPFSKVVLDAEDVFTSSDASKPTTFTFKSPVFIQERKEHAIVITSDSNQYKVFISILGRDAIDAAHLGEKISEQPYIGVLFKSQNASTWTPSQLEDLMFKIYRADFTVPTTAAPSKLVLENATLGESNGGSLRLAPNSMKFTSGSDEIRVFHSNHGMQSALNYVDVSGVISEVPDTTISASGGLSATATGAQLVVADASQFHTTIGGSAVSSSNLGFVKILGTEENGSGDEIIAYEAINGNTLTINASGRNYSGSSGTGTGKAHLQNAVVQCYNIAGIPLTLVNTTHNSTTGGIISINSPHSYNLKINSKNAGKSIQSGGPGILISQNIPWDVLTPQIQSQVEPQTGLAVRVQGTSGTSCGPFGTSSAETSFVKDTAYTDVTVGEENYFPATKVIANQLNEINRMNNVKSFTMELDLTTEVSHLSPVVDLTRCQIITTGNVYNNIEPTSGVGGECASNYITKVARMEKSATGLKVMCAANTWTDSKIVVMYKLVPVGYAGSLDDLEFRFFNTTGVPDNGALIPQNDLSTFTDYEYTIEDTDEFDGFQVKISLLGRNQPYIPRVKDFRAIALA